MHVITIIISKVGLWLLQLLGRGGSFPGKFALKFDKHIISYFKLPENVIAVTGSSGKTSTSYLIANALKKNGYKVAHNTSGANLSAGFTTLLIRYCKLNGKIDVDALVFEVDERYTREILNKFKPKYFVVTNITRDQPPRHGNYEIVYNCIKDSLKKDIVLVTNGDDPLATKLSLEHEGKTVYFGLGKHKDTIKSPITNAIDFIYCPKCHTKLKYDYVSFSNVGSYKCPKCDFKRPNINYEITKVDDYLTINKDYKVKPNTDITYTFYNIIGAYSVLAEMGIKEDKISELLSDIKLKEKRYDYIKYKDRDCYILSGKNENAPSYNQVVNYISKDNDIKTIMFGFEYISLRYPHQDISWLYDIDFELLNDKSINTVICLGPWAYDLAVRFKLAGISEKKIIVCKNLHDVKKYLDKSKGKIYGILNLGTDAKISKIVGEE